MSEVYALEPATKGKVILITTLGPLEIDLWSKECPKASRNFIQLCLEGFYNNTKFHRVIKDFLIQGGDPLGDGTGGESIYGTSSFPNEYHSRLKFRYKGVVAVASHYPESNLSTRSNLDPLAIEGDVKLGEPVNGSQFFITLNRAEGLNGKHTIFGRVTGQTIWNLVRIGELETDAFDRPVEDCRILSCDVVWNPYDDIVPRELPPRLIAPTEAANIVLQSNAEPRKTVAKRRSALLSFGADSEEDDGEERMKSAHDLLAGVDLSLSKEVIDFHIVEQREQEDIHIDATETKAAQEKKMEAIKEKILSLGTSKVESRVGDLTLEMAKEYESHLRERVEVKSEGRIGTTTKLERELASVQDADLLDDRERRRELLKTRKASKSRTAKESRTMNLLLDFEKRLKSANTSKRDETISVEEDDDTADWMATGGLKFAVDSSTAYAFDAAQNALAVYDPLKDQPMTREQTQSLQRRKGGRLRR